MSQVLYRDKVWGWRLIIHLNISSIIIIIRIRARYQHKHRTTQRNAPLFSSGWFSPSQLAISTGHRQWQRRRRQRRVSIIHSADNQKSWKHTFMRRVSSQRNGGKRDKRETERPGVVQAREEKGGHDGASGQSTTGGDAEGMRRERANSRNQDDKRRVGAVMHDAQIRAIIPITVQIIVREPTRRAASVQTQPATPCPARTTTIRIRGWYRAGGAEWFRRTSRFRARNCRSRNGCVRLGDYISIRPRITWWYRRGAISLSSPMSSWTSETTTTTGVVVAAGFNCRVSPFTFSAPR